MTRSLSLIDADPDLVEGIPQDDLALAERVLTMPLYEIPAGRWAPGLLRGHGNAAFGILVVAGAIVRQIDLADRHCSQILGPGDVVHEASSDGLLACPVSWSALQPSAVVVLDARFTLASRRWPSLGVNLQRRLLRQADRVALHAAIGHLPRVERRVLALFWHLAERWGHVTPAGMALPLRLTHEAIGRLVGAQRPTVTLALGDLADEGLLSRTPAGDWLLAPDSRELLRPADGSQASVRPAEEALA